MTQVVDKGKNIPQSIDKNVAEKLKERYENEFKRVSH